MGRPVPEIIFTVPEALPGMWNPACGEFSVCCGSRLYANVKTRAEKYWDERMGEFPLLSGLSFGKRQKFFQNDYNEKWLKNCSLPGCVSARQQMTKMAGLMIGRKIEKIIKVYTFPASSGENQSLYAVLGSDQTPRLLSCGWSVREFAPVRFSVRLPYRLLKCTPCQGQIKKKGLVNS